MPRKNIGKKINANGQLQDLGNTLSDEDLAKLDSIEENAQRNVQADWKSTSGDSFIKNKPTIPNVSNFITKDVNNLTNYTLAVDEASVIDLSIDTTTYVLTAKLLNSKGTEISKDTIDLPLETMVIGASYDSTNKQITLTLQNGTTTSFSVADLVSGLVPNTRKVNGKALSDDISLNASDVGALADTTTYVSSVNGNSGAISNIATTNSSQTLLKKSFQQVTINEGTCSTASSIATKVVTLENFELKTGAIIDVKFTNASYYDNGTTSGLTLALNVNSTGAKNIMLRRTNSGTAISTMGSKSQYTRWYSNEVVRFRYDGSYWSIVCNLTSMTNYMRPILGSPIRYNKADGTSTYWYATADLDLTHLLPSTVQYVAQTLTDAQKTQARTNIGAGTSSFSGSYTDLTNKPTIPSGAAASKDVVTSITGTTSLPTDLAVKTFVENKGYTTATGHNHDSNYQTKGTIDVTDTTPTSATKYYPMYTLGKGTGQTARANNDFYYYDSGSWSSLNIGSMGNKGILTLHYGTSSTDRYVDISPASALTANRTLTIPDASGTIALTSDLDYTKLSNKPTIPTNTNQLTNGAGFVTSSGSVATATNATKLNNQEPSYYLNYNNLSNKPTIPDTSKLVTTNTEQTISSTKYFDGAYLIMKGAAADKRLRTRGISGANSDGTVGDLYLQYDSSYKTYWGNSGQSQLNSDGSISLGGKAKISYDSTNQCVKFTFS